MTGKRSLTLGKILYLAALLLCLFELARLWTIAPAQMAAHFNVQGDVDRFVPKPEFFRYQVQTLLIVLGASLLPQFIFMALPANLVNMPNRDYWLAPERRAETMGRIQDFGWMMFGVILLAVQAAFEISTYANFQTPIRFNVQLMSGTMIVALGAIILMLVQLIVSFRLPSSE